MSIGEATDDSKHFSDARIVTFFISAMSKSNLFRPKVASNLTNVTDHSHLKYTKHISVYTKLIPKSAKRFLDKMSVKQELKRQSRVSLQTERFVSP